MKQAAKFSSAYPVKTAGLTPRILIILLRTVNPAAEVKGVCALGGQTFGDDENKVSTAGRAEVELKLRGVVARLLHA